MSSSSRLLVVCLLLCCVLSQASPSFQTLSQAFSSGTAGAHTNHCPLELRDCEGSGTMADTGPPPATVDDITMESQAADSQEEQEDMDTSTPDQNENEDMETREEEGERGGEGEKEGATPGGERVNEEVKNKREDEGEREGAGEKEGTTPVGEGVEEVKNKRETEGPSTDEPEKGGKETTNERETEEKEVTDERETSEKGGKDTTNERETEGEEATADEPENSEGVSEEATDKTEAVGATTDIAETGDKDGEGATDERETEGGTATTDEPETSGKNSVKEGEGKVKKISKWFGRGKRERKDDQKTAKKPRTEPEKEEAVPEPPLPPFATTLEGFQYAFNEEGRLRHTETGEAFVFEVKKGDKRYNQAHYEALGEVITEHVYHLLETEGKLKKTVVPLGVKEHEAKSFVFESSDARSNKDKLMVLIHGSGVVRAGQWARRLIINDCLESGTQLPYIKKAQAEGYAVLVLNTNRNSEVVAGKEMTIKDSSTPEEHAEYVWSEIIEKCPAKEIFIVAHSYGGVVTTCLADSRKIRKRFQERVKRIAFTDSVHNFELQRTNSEVKQWMIGHSRNWISCDDPLDTELMVHRRTVSSVSAGTKKHEETSYYAMDSIFKYFSKDD